MRRYAAKIDNNQNDIVDALRQLPGVTVEVGHDDILVGYQGRTFWYETKDPSVVNLKTGVVQPSKIKPSQKRLLATFKGHYKIVWELDQILKDIGII
jgi:hypothetical protein